MAEQSLNEFSQGCQADDLLQNLTQNLSPEAAEHARKLVMAMQNGPEEDTQKSKAVLELLLSKSSKANADEKPSLETESHVVSDNGGQNTTEQLHCTTVNSEACVSGNEVEKNGNEMTREDVNSAEVGEKDFDATADEPLTESEKLTDIAVDKEVINQLSFKEESTNQLPVNGKNGTGGGDGNLIVSETEKLPEILSLKVNDMYCEDHLETELPVLDEKGGSNLMEKVPPTEFHSRINLLSESTETDRTYPSCNPVGYKSSSEDAKSSLHSDVSSVSGELSDRMGASSEALNAKSEEANRIDLRNNEGESVTPLMETVLSQTVASDASNEVLNMETSQETVTENTQQVLERKLSVLSTGTQTSSDENLRGDQAVGDQEFLDHDALSSILAKKGKESSRMPFYYQPEIVMHGQQPFLVLQPVVLASLPCKENEGSCHGEKDVDKSKVPVILPLAAHDVDNATKDAVLDQINGACSLTSFMGDSKDFLLQHGQRFGDVPPSLNSVQLSGFNEQDGNKRSLDAVVAVTSALPVKENKTEGLPEWVPPSELDKAFSAVKERVAVSSSEKTATSLTFPSISLPNANPFARDLEAMDRGNGDVKVDDVTSLGLDKVLQQSLFGPPTSLRVSPQGARPKQLKGYQEPVHSVQSTNPFTPDLTPKKHGKRQDQYVSEQENELVVAADVHSPAISQPPNRSPRHQLSSKSMVTLIETTYADTPTSFVELATSVAQEPIHTTQVKEVPIQCDRNLNEGTESVHNKRVLKVPGRKRPVWIPDSACSNCSNCNVKFTVFVRKHHCRGCGKIFCNECSSQLARFPYMDYRIGRVCPKCTEAIREASQKMRKSIAVPKQSVLQQGSGIKQQMSQSMQKKEEPFEQTAINQVVTVQNSRKPGSVQSLASQGVVMPQPQVSQGVIMPQGVVKPQAQNSQFMIQQPQNFQGVILPPPQASQTIINPQPETVTEKVTAGEGDLGSKEKPPLRRAGRTSWRKKTQEKNNLQEQRKFLAKDLRDLPNGVIIQAGPELFVNVKKMRLKEKTRELMVWCFKSQGLQKVNHSELVVMLEVRKEEDIFPEEVLRVYKGILYLASKFGNYFEHGNYLSSNKQFLESSSDAGFLFVSSEIKPKPLGLKDMKTPFLYGILIKRCELPAAMFTPGRLLLRLGYEMKSFPFPLWSSRDRKPVNFGNGQDDRFYHTLSAMDKYLKTSVPEALVPGLYVVKEDNKVILQIPNSGQRAVVDLFDRLVEKESQTATVPLLSDKPPYVDHCMVVLCKIRGGKYVQSSRNVSNSSVVGLGFLMLHLGVDSSSPLCFGGELLDDGVLLFFSKSHTEQLRQSLKERSNCYFYLGDKFEIAHFELRWMQDASYLVTRVSRQNLQQKTPVDSIPSSPTETSTTNTTAGDKTVQGTGSDY
ncbi:uncharacterized protein [Montipora foliosa]|uniref:uncharacterized protein isoform X1 n=2 Tax=Montipora foliosa TaxID=591990 RepID=UPI0035F1A117